MKKKSIILISLIMVFVLTACGNQTIKFHKFSFDVSSGFSKSDGEYSPLGGENVVCQNYSNEDKLMRVSVFDKENMDDKEYDALLSKLFDNKEYDVLRVFTVDNCDALIYDTTKQKAEENSDIEISFSCCINNPSAIYTVDYEVFDKAADYENSYQEFLKILESGCFK